MVKNYGISFGISGTFFIVLSVVFVFIFIGGFLNLFERIIFGYVRDYWNFLGVGLYNNINDWIIGVGVLICLIDLLWKKSK